jgi:type VI secretion system protein ImpL
LKQILESIRDETAVTRERKKEEKTDEVPKAAVDAAAAVNSTAGAIAKGADAVTAALKRQQKPGNPRVEIPGSDIERNFKELHVIVDGDEGKRPIDSLLVNLDNLYRKLTLAAQDETQVQRTMPAVQEEVANLRANANRLPPPFKDMMEGIATDVAGDVADTSIAQLSQSLASEVTGPCTQIITNRYPFAAKSDRDVPMADFTRLFAPGGVLDAFFAKNLAPLVDSSGKSWAWRTNIPLTRDLSGTTLRQFQQASQIRAAFFPANSPQPALKLEIRPGSFSSDADSAIIQFNASQITFQHDTTAPTAVQWPGAASIEISSIDMQPALPDRISRIERRGPWSLFRLLDAGSVRQRGNAVGASFIVGSREISFEVSVDALQNPFTLPALRQFKCPNGL